MTLGLAVYLVVAGLCANAIVRRGLVSRPLDGAIVMLTALLWPAWLLFALLFIAAGSRR